MPAIDANTASEGGLAQMAVANMVKGSPGHHSSQRHCPPRLPPDLLSRGPVFACKGARAGGEDQTNAARAGKLAACVATAPPRDQPLSTTLDSAR